MGQENDIIQQNLERPDGQKTGCTIGRSRGRRVVFRGKGIPNKSKSINLILFLFSSSSLLVSCLNTTTPASTIFSKLLLPNLILGKPRQKCTRSSIGSDVGHPPTGI